MELASGWKKLHNDELHSLYSAPNISRVIKPRKTKWAELVVCGRDIRNAHRILVRKLQTQKLLGRPWHRQKYNTKNWKSALLVAQ
jgi:hypothetical protein